MLSFLVYYIGNLLSSYGVYNIFAGIDMDRIAKSFSRSTNTSLSTQGKAECGMSKQKWKRRLQYTTAYWLRFHHTFLVVLRMCVSDARDQIPTPPYSLIVPFRRKALRDWRVDCNGICSFITNSIRVSGEPLSLRILDG